MDLFGSNIIYEQMDLTSGKNLLDNEAILCFARRAIEEVPRIDYDELKVARISRKSICVELWTNNAPTHFAKIHLSLATYERELLFYTLFSSLPFLLAFHHGCGREKIIILEYLSFSAGYKASGEDMIWLFRSIGKIHATWELLQSEFMLASPCHVISDATANKLPRYASLSQTRIAVAFLSGRQNNYIPMSIGDLQPAHFWSDQQRRFLIDFDTFSLGRCEALDLIFALSRFPIDLKYLAPSLILEYTESRSSLGSFMDLRSVVSDLCDLAAVVRHLHPEMCAEV